MNLQSYAPIAERIAEVVDYIMLNELRLFPPERYEVDSSRERVAIVASFNPLQLGRSLAAYENNDVARRLTEALDGIPVVITRKMGLRYVIALSGRPQLPRMAELPETRPGFVSLGVRYTGEPVIRRWARLGHTMAAGKTRSGKSAFLRLLAFQAMRDDFLLAIADNDRSTFPMLRDHPALFAPIASDPQAASALIERIMAECDARATAFEAIGGVDNLDEYNQRVNQPMKPMLVILDELSNTILVSGSKRKQLTDMLGALGMRALKFGIYIVFAAHEFTKDQIGMIRPQCETIICFRNEQKEMSALMNCAGAEKIPQERQGMAMTNKWGRVQMYFLDRSRLEVQREAKSPIPENEWALIKRSILETEGRMSIPLLKAWGMSEREARGLVTIFEQRGWLEKDGMQKNARYVTAKLRDLLSNCQTGQTVSNSQDWSQTDVKLDMATA